MEESMTKADIDDLEIEHSMMVQNLVKPGEEILKTLTPEKVELWHMASCICGEAGELFDAVKRYVIYNKDIDKANVKEECGDIEFYMKGLRKLMGITRPETLQDNMTKLLARYPNYQYTDKRAQERADKKEVSENAKSV